jgi:hypothetical protein
MPEEKSLLIANSSLKCMNRIGVLNLVIDNSPNGFDTVVFYCNQLAGHLGPCHFQGKELVVIRNMI